MLTQLLTFLAFLIMVLTAHASEPVAGHLDYSIDSKAEFKSYSQSGQRLQYVVLTPWEPDRMRALKQANPNLKVLVYQNLLGSVKGMTSNGFAPTPVLYEEANSSHPDWFLKNTEGDRFTLRNYPYLWAMDVGNESYQQRWTERVIETVKSQGWDGVFIDNVDPTLKYYASVPSVAKYPNDPAFSAATESALKNISPQLHAAHMLVFANFGSWDEYYDTVTPWLKYVDGAMDEMFLKYSPIPGDGYLNEIRWSRQLEELKETQRQNKVFLAITHSAGSDRSAALYGWATVLLGANGNAAFELAERYAEETWFPEYEYDIGNPVGPEVQESDGVHRRSFSQGLVLVNPLSASRRVPLNGTYSGSGLESATEATMAPHSGLVLIRDSGPDVQSSFDTPGLSAQSIAARDGDNHPTMTKKRLAASRARKRRRRRRGGAGHRGRNETKSRVALDSLVGPVH